MSSAVFAVEIKAKCSAKSVQSLSNIVDHCEQRQQSVWRNLCNFKLWPLDSSARVCWQWLGSFVEWRERGTEIWWKAGEGGCTVLDLSSHFRLDANLYCSSFATSLNLFLQKDGQIQPSQLRCLHNPQDAGLILESHLSREIINFKLLLLTVHGRTGNLHKEPRPLLVITSPTRAESTLRSVWISFLA